MQILAGNRAGAGLLSGAPGRRSARGAKLGPDDQARRAHDAAEAGMSPAELETAFQEHHPRMLRAAYRVTGNLADAEDVLQTVFLRMLRTGKPEVPEAQLGHYLSRAAINAGLDVVRGRARRQQAPLEALKVAEVRAGSSEGGATSSRDARLENEALRQQLRAALTQLSPRAAEMFALRYFEGFGNKEIAELWGTSESAVGVTLHRARARMRQELESSEAAAGENR